MHPSQSVINHLEKINWTIEDQILYLEKQMQVHNFLSKTSHDFSKFGKMIECIDCMVHDLPIGVWGSIIIKHISIPDTLVFLPWIIQWDK